MIQIAESKRWQCGKYTIQQRPRPDNPAFPTYLVFVGDKFIGSEFSLPDEGACRWLELNGAGNYAPRSAPRDPQPLRGAARAKALLSPLFHGKRGRPTKAEQARRLALAPDAELDGAY